MKNRMVMWGTNAEDERILVALELMIERNKVMIYTFPSAMVTEDFYQQMMESWRNNKADTVFPQGHQAIERELSVAESVLPADIKVERPDLITRAETEWQFVILSHKLNEAYRSELKDMEERIAHMQAYSKEAWDELKSFWDKVQEQINFRSLMREHGDELRKRTNQAFEELKSMRSKMDDTFKRTSTENFERFNSLLQDVEERITSSKAYNQLFEELKGIQKDIKDFQQLTRDHRNKLWERLDNGFKAIKETRSAGRPEGAGGGGGQNDNRLQQRYKGLMDALQKMQSSVQRDESELEFQQRKIDRTVGQLELQIRQAKTQMLEQRLVSKREKLADMLATKTQLEERLAKTEEGKAIMAQTLGEPEQSDAAPRRNKKGGDDSVLGAMGVTLGEAFADVIDTVRAVADVVGKEVEEKIQDIKESFEDKQEATPEATPAVEEATAAETVEAPAEEVPAPEEAPVVEAVETAAVEEAVAPEAVAETVEAAIEDAPVAEAIEAPAAEEAPVVEEAAAPEVVEATTDETPAEEAASEATDPAKEEE